MCSPQPSQFTRAGRDRDVGRVSSSEVSSGAGRLAGTDDDDDEAGSGWPGTRFDAGSGGGGGDRILFAGDNGGLVLMCWRGGGGNADD
jgi:hypothetical protein